MTPPPRPVAEAEAMAVLAEHRVLHLVLCSGLLVLGVLLGLGR